MISTEWHTTEHGYRVVRVTLDLAEDAVLSMTDENCRLFGRMIRDVARSFALGGVDAMVGHREAEIRRQAGVS